MRRAFSTASNKPSTHDGQGWFRALKSWLFPGNTRASRATQKLEEAKSKLKSTGPSQQMVQSIDETVNLPSDVLLRTKSVKQLRELANAAFNGSGVQEADKKRAIGLWAAAAMKGDPASALQLAVCYMRGEGVERDEDKAVEILEDIVENVKLPWASFALANIYTERHQKLETEEDRSKMERCFQLYKDAAIAGIAPAYLNVYNFLTMGIGCERNDTEALNWLRDAAQQQDPMAMYYMAARYSQGAGVERDDEKAFELFKRAASKGIVNAAHNVGAALMEGKGCRVNYEAASKWFDQAIDKSHVPSMLNQGLMCERGLGTEQDLDKALAWYLTAAAVVGKQRGSDSIPGFIQDKVEEIKKMRGDPERAAAIRGQFPEVNSQSENSFQDGADRSDGSQAGQASLNFTTGLPKETDENPTDITAIANDQEAAKQFIQEANETDMTPDSLDKLLRKHISRGNVRLKSTPNSTTAGKPHKNADDSKS
eukprot:gb/GECG01009517.1/.p1 GENE.gb/GECG01009517.1/~~gb/GECG01009517.1/.p1  ORF type:complete len:483 (+),score=73.58 gb/GECG01009517.1/:1-1449(+)